MNKSFKEFLTEQGVLNVDDFISFLESLPSDTGAIVQMTGIEQYHDQINKAFNIFFKNSS